MSYESDILDARADEWQRMAEELRFIEAQEEVVEQAILYGTPLMEISPTDTIFQIVQWIIKFGDIKATIPLADGRMTTKQSVVDAGVENGGKYYVKTGWYTKDGISCVTHTPDEFILDLVNKEFCHG